MKKKLWIAIITFLLLMTFAFPSLASSAGFNKVLPVSGIHASIATGERTRSSLKVSMTYFRQDFTGTAPKSTDRAIFYAKWNYKAGDLFWKTATGEIWLKHNTSGTSNYTKGGLDYKCMASTSWMNLNTYRIKGTVTF